MEASHDDLARLLQLQTIDLDILSHQRELDELPQRGRIMDARNRRAAIEEQQAKVASLKKDVERKMTRVNDEDASLLKRQQGVQAALEAAQGDFRNVEARSKELDGIVKRRNALEEDIDRLNEEMMRIEQLEDQVERAKNDIAAKEQAAIASFQKEGGVLKQQIADLKVQREAIAAELPTDLLKRYEKTAVRTGGVAVARLLDNRCGACRSVIDSGRLIELRSQAPLGICPSCKRLLIIE